MKKLILSLLSFSGFIISHAQKSQDFTGTWSGKINVGVELRVVFHIKATADGVFSSTTDSPDQSTYGLKCDTTIISGDQLYIKMSNLGASFTGKMLNDSTIDGKLKQMSEIPLLLKRGESIVKRNRPQTPQPPFPYKSIDVEYDNA